MRAKFHFVMFISLFFSISTLFADEIFVPLHNGEKIELDTNKFLNAGYSYSTHKTIYWEMQNAFSVQKINHLGEMGNTENVNVPLVFCKGMTLSLSLNENWKLTSLFVAGFTQKELPAMFTPNSILYLQDDWISFNSEVILSRKIPISKRFSISPFIGYDYNLFAFSEIIDAQKIDSRHSVITGAEISLKPANRVEISASAFTSIFLNMTPTTQPKFYAGTKFNAAVSIYKVYLNFFNTIKFNFSSSSNSLNFSPNNLSIEFVPFYSIEAGVGFRVAL